ncbi:MAG: hypothetical protein LBJ77_02335 [Holosporales bacterium]|nr:hypothetical protein [Holosporales bacterium]
MMLLLKLGTLSRGCARSQGRRGFLCLVILTLRLPCMGTTVYYGQPWLMHFPMCGGDVSDLGWDRGRRDALSGCPGPVFVSSVPAGTFWWPTATEDKLGCVRPDYCLSEDYRASLNRAADMGFRGGIWGFDKGTYENEPFSLAAYYTAYWTEKAKSGRFSFDPLCSPRPTTQPAWTPGVFLGLTGCAVAGIGLGWLYGGHKLRKPKWTLFKTNGI